MIIKKRIYVDCVFDFHGNRDKKFEQELIKNTQKGIFIDGFISNGDTSCYYKSIKKEK